MMARPLIHARNSMKRYGGSVDDYLEIDNSMDSTRLHCLMFDIGQGSGIKEL